MKTTNSDTTVNHYNKRKTQQFKSAALAYSDCLSRNAENCGEKNKIAFE